MFSDITKLFRTPLRIKLLKYFALQPDERFTITQLASALGAGKRVTQSDVAALQRVGIIVAKAAPGGRVYGWNRAHPRAFAIQNFVVDSTTPDDRIVQNVFRRLGVHLVIVAGSLADETRSSVDLLVVTKRPRDPRLARAVKKLEAVTAVPIRYAVMEVKEYEARKESYDRLLRDITDFRHRVVLSRQ